MLNLFDSVAKIKGVGEKKLNRLNYLNIYTIQDLLNHFPVRYVDKRTVTLSNKVDVLKPYLVEGILTKTLARKISANRTIIECTFKDSAGTFVAVFFNMPFLKKTLVVGRKYVLYGNLRNNNGVNTWTNPEISESGSEKDHRGIIPKYRCTSGINNSDLYKWINYALQNVDFSVDWIGQEIKDKNKLCDIDFAYRNIHFPKSDKHYKASLFRIVYDQLLVYQLAIRINKESLLDKSLDASIPKCDFSEFENNYNFIFTNGQIAAIKDIERDLLSSKAMNRLIQGDVGSGKTIVAEAGIYMCAKAGLQAAFMAPTEILAKQHYKNISNDMSKFGFKTCLLTSGMKKREREDIINEIQCGKINIIVGTHAIIQDDVIYNNLGIVITDEQHRFGVNQRKLLANKGRGVNVCVMSATPIPRTLATTVFGDMDFSIIRDRPANRKKIITKTFTEESRERAYTLLKKEIELGHQAYVVAPSINSDDESMSSVENLYNELREKYSNFDIKLIHGKLDTNEKESIMLDFVSGKIDILVSTTVIEEGIDVPNASVIVIENSERFGLAQMHQLRGRVGRSDIQSYCFLINYSNSDTSKARVDALVETSDGFEISEIDYNLRGPGDITGTIQSGNFSSKILSLCKYENILELAINDADKIYKDQNLCDMNYLKRNMESFNNDNSNII